MAQQNHTDLNSGIDSNITTNGNGGITGAVLNQQLKNVADSAVNILGDSVGGKLAYVNNESITDDKDIPHKKYVDDTILSKTLTGFTESTGDITASDNTLTALEKLKGNADDLESLTVFEDSDTIGITTSLTTYSVAAASVSTRAVITPFPFNGELSEIEFYASRRGVFKFKIIHPNGDDTFTLVREFNVNVDAGLNTLVGGVDYPVQIVESGDILGWYVTGVSGYVGYKTQNGNFYSLASDATGTFTFTTTTTITFGLNFTVRSGQLDSRISTLEDEITTINKRGRGIGNVKFTPFYSESLPSGWIESGSWVHSSSGTSSPATGGWSTYMYWDKLFTPDEDMVWGKFVINTATSIFSIARFSSQAYGTVAEIDLTAMRINLYSEYTSIGATPSSVVSFIPITITITAGQEYIVTLKKISEVYYVRLTNTVNGTYNELSYNAVGSTSVGKCWNGHGVIFRSGSIKVLEFNYSTSLPNSPKVLLIGDSITDGDTIRNEQGGGYTNRYAGLIETALDQNMTIIGRGGETSSDVNNKLSFYTSLLDKPQYVIYAIGINDTSFSTWQTNFLAFKSAFEAKGAEVIPITLFPRTGREAFCTQVTNYVLTYGGRYVDWAKAMTTNGDRTTRDSSFFLADNLHPNPYGHKRLYKQHITDLPDIFI